MYGLNKVVIIIGIPKKNVNKLNWPWRDRIQNLYEMATEQSCHDTIRSPKRNATEIYAVWKETELDTIILAKQILRQLMLFFLNIKLIVTGIIVII